MLNFHKCIADTASLTDDTYLNNLTLREDQKHLLRDARRLVRDKLRAAFVLETKGYFQEGRPITPSYFTQGSWGYKTINRPTHVPPQQADMDDGCFLPMSFVRGDDPKFASTRFFEIADNALNALVAEQGWKAYDTSKDTCCRIILDDENHVDVPLYAIRDDKFVEMKKLALERASDFREAVATAIEQDDYDFDWSMVAEADVLLAHRSGIWSSSNPMDVTDWVNTAADQHGPQLRRIWRGAKGWRDNAFPDSGGPSSICLMVLIEEAFEEIPKRDDLALVAAARHMRACISQRVEAPWDRREDLNRLNEEERQRARALFADLERSIDSCLQGDIAHVKEHLATWQKQFGKHFCNDSTRVSEDQPSSVVHAHKAAPAVYPPFRGDNRSA